MIVNRDNRVVAGGYNGMPRGIEDNSGLWGKEGPALQTKYPYVVHAEQNALANWYHRESGNFYRVYVTKFPCSDCAKLLIQSGIKEVIYAEKPHENKVTYQASARMFRAASVRTRLYDGRPSVKLSVADFRADFPVTRKSANDRTGASRPKTTMAADAAGAADAADGMIKFTLDEGAHVPTCSTAWAAGWDVRAIRPVVIPANGSATVSTGVHTEFPADTVCFVKGRSGLAFKHGVVAFQGTIDSDYRGEIKVLLHNSGCTDFHVSEGDRVAQLVFLALAPHDVDGVTVHAVRGEGGFGSTGAQ